MTDLDAAAAGYAAAHRAHEAAAELAQAASARLTAERTADAQHDCGAAWRKADRAMRAMWDARDRLCEAALARGQGVLL